MYFGEGDVYNFISSMIKDSKQFSKDLVMTKKDNKDFLRTLLNAGSVIMIVLMVMLKQEIIVISLENVEVLHIEIIISILN